MENIITEMNEIIRIFGEKYVPAEMKKQAEGQLRQQNLEEFLEKLSKDVPQLKFVTEFGMTKVNFGHFIVVDIDHVTNTAVTKNDPNAAKKMAELPFFAQAQINWACDQIKTFCEKEGFDVAFELFI